MSENTCETCRWFKRGGGQRIFDHGNYSTYDGKCKRYPVTEYKKEYDFCGEWRGKGETISPMLTADVLIAGLKHQDKVETDEALAASRRRLYDLHEQIDEEMVAMLDEGETPAKDDKPWRLLTPENTVNELWLPMSEAEGDMKAADMVGLNIETSRLRRQRLPMDPWYGRAMEDIESGDLIEGCMHLGIIRKVRKP